MRSIFSLRRFLFLSVFAVFAPVWVAALMFDRFGSFQGVGRGTLGQPA